MGTKKANEKQANRQRRLAAGGIHSATTTQGPQERGEKKKRRTQKHKKTRRRKYTKKQIESNFLFPSLQTPSWHRKRCACLSAPTSNASSFTAKQHNKQSMTKSRIRAVILLHLALQEIDLTPTQLMVLAFSVRVSLVPHPIPS